MPTPKPWALVSLTDRTGLAELTETLSAAGFNLVATSGTAAAIRALGVRCREVEDLTGFPPILDGRVKTLHPKIFGGILARGASADHTNDLKQHDIARITVVAVTLYTFQAAVARGDIAADAVDHIDIGGVALLRAAAKNYETATVLSSSAQYEEFADALRRGGPTLHERQRWAACAMSLVADYDAAIAAYLRSLAGEQPLPDELTLRLPLQHRLRYGENPGSLAAFYHSALTPVTFPKQVSGKTLSYNNLLDVDSCLRLLAPVERPAGFGSDACAEAEVKAAIVKHTVPCGFAAAPTGCAALCAALGADPISAFGGIVAVSAEIDDESAELLKPRFLEVVAAPAFSPAALAVLRSKKNLRMLTFDPGLPARLCADATVRSALGGILLEQPDGAASPEAWTVVTERTPTPEQWRDLLFALRAVRQVKSNAAVVAKDEVTLGICGGQTNRVVAVELACKRAGAAVLGAVLATDGFFPFADGIEAALSAGIAAVVAPAGSIRDAEVIEAARKGGIALVFTSRRYFLH
ncbi:MAG: bifunctional phosphoribosylaminoimidazolecarboxamide formyltransferase/IMP cyclohydrolase [Candidatus Eremiobacter antarcticus]|nr:bifunctional phosphoribosylaminoimidazolecarboxamide formyltransferase/IMP cyclohydrolase [Candidatus Eremiobacteraeota bacterium]MBC5808214.1 bifunctional phosphoribosylaminoimidazolecarboxamide formyltransferase/IMP cyclohydrolase [Candidatus Eremiobacteraeota bacterium]